MIADEALAAGLKRWFDSIGIAPQVFIVPWAVAPTFAGAPAGGGMMLEFPIDSLAVKLCPMIRDPGGRTFDATWGRKPYPGLIIASARPEPGVLAVYTHPSDPSINAIDRATADRWHFLWCFIVGRRWVPLYGGFATHDFNTGALRAPIMETQAHSDNLHQVTLSASEAFGLHIPGMEQPPSAASWEGPNRAVALSALTLFSLLNAKNVVAERVSPALSRAARRRGEAPPISYHVLRVRPLAAIRSESGAPTGAQLPIHWVRGHFKIFTAERPLFGRFSGRFWWQPSLHGRDKARRVDKTYQIDSGPEPDGAA